MIREGLGRERGVRWFTGQGEMHLSRSYTERSSGLQISADEFLGDRRHRLAAQGKWPPRPQFISDGEVRFRESVFKELAQRINGVSPGIALVGYIALQHCHTH